MSNLKHLKEHFESIKDMQTIISTMKSLAVMESKKLNRYLGDQGRCAKSIREVAADFLTFHPLPQNHDKLSHTLIIAIGADRGFCGNFNEQIIDVLKEETQRKTNLQADIIAVGDRLSSRLEKEIKLTDKLHGATFAEEVPSVISSVIEKVQLLIEKNTSRTVKIKILAHQYGQDELNIFEPLTELQRSPASYGNAPNLTLHPNVFLPKLLNQYFQFVLYQFFYSSLIAENARRIMHLESALQKLEDTSYFLKRQYNQARQEEITEEIEILIMNLQNLDRLR